MTGAPVVASTGYKKYLPMKLPWIRLPTSTGRGTDTPTPNPSMISPRSKLSDVSRTNPVPPTVWLPSMITRGWALLPSLAMIVLGVDVIMIGSAIGDSAHRRRLDTILRIGTQQAAPVADEVGNGLPRDWPWKLTV